ncbi:G-type lectin S-receptor-like serine/threonine-protein kinase At1g11410 [Argentina anserina]|uniref:G-type lectin S-receptor-like serine/threonine-protein kinase At1g11410 n=1 Tax=Argentina anserina TaxID=57926 RepID=UPI002176660A|nr:G-type lectin S-receptor-like serine/threonine-protein kinase At1g11410 [Potentilla anserina]
MHLAKDFLHTFLQLLLLLRLCQSLDTTITSSKSIKDGDFLVSENQMFVLGFFSPGTTRHRYVGIWYKFSEDMVVWVANRDDPVNDTSGILTINGDGNLVLLQNSSQGLPLWSTNVSVRPVSNNSTMVQLLDSGNLVLVTDLVNNRSGFLWQSFDYPTSVIISNMKIGMDHGKNIFLTSWNSKDDPGTGIFPLRTEPNGSPQIILYKNRTKLWRAGPWNGLHWYGLPDMNKQRNTPVSDIAFVNNEDEVTTKWFVLDPSVVSIVVIDGSGSVQQLAWQGQPQGWTTIWSAPTDECDKYGRCGPFGICKAYTANWETCACFPGYEPNSPEDWKLREGSGGCKRQQGAPSMCRNGEGFVKIQNLKIPDTSTIKLDMNLTMDACEKLCLNNCSCLAYASADVRNGGSGCMTWYGDLMDTTQFAQGQGQDLYIRANAIVSAKYRKKSKIFLAKKGMWLIFVCPPIAMIFLIFIRIWCFRRKTIGSLTNHYESKTHKDLEYFDLRSILVATDNFSTANKLGEGGFGSVYKGRLANEEEVAVKRLSKNSGQGLEQFKTEVKLIAKLQHKNLVRLLGCCINSEEKMLIYEYLPNKSLDYFIFDRSRSFSIDWKGRFDIINGIARGILYLHEDSRLKIIHRDIKASNILLDSTMNPNISDFGLAKLIGEDQLQANTNRVIGTYGYMSPEYAMEGRYSTKSDVFSFGVLLLEIISGKKNTDHNLDSPSLNLIGKVGKLLHQVWGMWREGQALGILDPSLSSYPAQEVSRCIHIGLLCVQESTTDRPTMSEVVYMLGKETPLTSPKKPAFILQSSNPNSEEMLRRGPSQNNVTITMPEAR